jgi:hypothetical protein
MTVFLTHAGADREAADNLAKVFERRGLFVEDEDGGHGFRPLMARDVVVLLWSNAALMSPHRLLMERRALEAWAEGRLVLVRLDHGFPPVGLRDLPAIDATFEAQRAFTWEEVVRAVQAALSAPPDDLAGAPPPMSMPAPSRRPDPPPVAAAAGKGAGAAGGLAWLFIIIAALAAGLFVALHFKLVPDLGVKPLHPDALPGPVFWIGVAAALLALLFSLNAMARKTPPASAKRAASPQAQAEAPVAAAEPAPIFISYAHADTEAVAPLAAAVADEVRPVWIDKQGIAASETWAGEIVRGIKTAAGVVVMCSAAAYQSDHVKREIYLADRYKKRLLPVLLDAAPAPEDFEYFFAGVQYLDAAGLNAQARAHAVVRLAASL